MDKTKSFIMANWKDPVALKTLLGTDYDGKSEYFHFGNIPKEQAKIETKNGKISRITTWSGLSWTARYGYSTPTVDIR